LGSELKVFGFRVCGLVFSVYGLGFWGSGSGCGVWPLQLQAWGFAKLTFGVRFKSNRQCSPWKASKQSNLFCTPPPRTRPLVAPLAFPSPTGSADSEIRCIRHGMAVSANEPNVPMGTSFANCLAGDAKQTSVVAGAVSTWRFSDVDDIALSVILLRGCKLRLGRGWL